jgi:hypothetical protein
VPAVRAYLIRSIFFLRKGQGESAELLDHPCLCKLARKLTIDLSPVPDSQNQDDHFLVLNTGDKMGYILLDPKLYSKVLNICGSEISN